MHANLLSFFVIGLVFVASCGKSKKNSAPAPESPNPTAECEARGEGWNLVEGECKNLSLTSEEQIAECNSKGETFRWNNGACVEVTKLTAEEKCILKGAKYRWDGGACLAKTAAVVINDENFASCIRNTKIKFTEEKTGEEKSHKVDRDEDGVLRQDELNSVKSLNCYAKGIRSLVGIENLPNLEEINCSGNQITAMPAFDKLTKLKSITCENNDFSDYDCPQYLGLKDRIAKDKLLIESQRDGRVLSCDQIKKVANIALEGKDNRANDIWGFDLNGKQYVVYGDVTHVNVVEAFDRAPYVKKIARADRGLVAGAAMHKDPNHTIWGEYRVFKKDGRAYLYGSTEANWGLIVKSLEGVIKTHGKKWCELPNAQDILKTLEPAHSKIQIFDITDIESADPAKRMVRINVPAHPELRSIHNITIDQATGLLVAYGGSDLDVVPKFDEKRDRCNFESKVGARLYSLSNPKLPTYLGHVGDLYVHDGQITTKEVNGSPVTRLYLAQGTTAIHWEANRHTNKDNRFAIFDISKKLVELGNAGLVEASPNTNLNVPAIIDQQYPNGYCHNIWVTDDESHVIITGETSVNEQLSFWKLDYATKTASQTSGVNFQGGPFAHNAFIKGDEIYVSHYSKGVVVLKIVEENGSKVIKPAWSYDTYPEHSLATFNGSWGVFPFATITPNLFFATDISNGLFVFRKEGTL